MGEDAELVTIISTPDFCYSVLSEPYSLIFMKVNASHIVTQLAIHLVCVIHVLNVHPRLLSVHKNNLGILILTQTIKLILRGKCVLVCNASSGVSSGGVSEADVEVDRNKDF